MEIFVITSRVEIVNMKLYQLFSRRSLGMTHQLKVLASNDGLEKDEGLSTRLVRRGGQEILQLHPEQLDTMLLQSPLPRKDQKYI